MRYVKEEQFVTAVGSPFRMKGIKNDLEAETDAASVSEVLHWLMTIYGNMPQQTGVILTMAECRHYNEAMSILEGEPQESGHYRFEDPQFEVVRKTTLAVLPIVSVRNCAVVEALLEGAPKQVHLRDVNEEASG